MGFLQGGFHLCHYVMIGQHGFSKLGLQREQGRFGVELIGG